MCGICGLVGSRGLSVATASVVEAMAQTIKHRGPDGEGIVSNDVGTFGHVRLAIVDVECGAQPIYNEDRSVGIVFNGEIYNYRELRDFLIAKGHVFITKTDTEVIVHLFEEFGENCFSKLIGMFAFALWTPQCVYLVRDQVGIKPLYYYQNGDDFIFCSEIKGLLSVPELDLSLDAYGIREYLTFRYCPSARTIFSKIKKLSAAHFMKIKNGRAELTRYFNLQDNIEVHSPDRRHEALLNVLLDVVGSQLMGEVPIGITLSGGIDSSVIAYLLNRLGANLEAFNIGFESANEFYYSEMVAQHFDLNHTMVLMRPQEAKNYLPKYVHAIDQPFGDISTLPLYKLCESIKDKVTVVLSGEGGDELFAGYPQYKSMANDFNTCSDETFRSFLERSWYVLNLNDYFHSVDTIKFPYRESFCGSLLSGMMNYDFHTWIPEDLMMKADKILMAHSLEGRFPFLDLRVMKVATGIPDGEKLHASGETKWILKDLMKGRLPREVLYRPKYGFTVPVEEVLLHVQEVVMDSIHSVSSLDSVIDRKKVLSTIKRFYGDHTSVYSLFVWTIFILYYWIHESLLSCKEKAEILPTVTQAGYLQETHQMQDVRPGNEPFVGPKRPKIGPIEKHANRCKFSETYISGSGIEIGGASYPLWTREGVQVTHVDVLSTQEMREQFTYLSKDDFLVQVDVIDDGEVLDSIEDQSLDFIIANHFLEHCEDPLRALRTHISKVRPGGILYYAVPDKRYTEDASRSLTTFQHILKDHEEGPEVSLREHYIDWAFNVNKAKSIQVAETKAQTFLHERPRIHFHVWDAESFREFLARAESYFDHAFDVEEFLPENENEFIVVLRRTIGKATKRK